MTINNTSVIEILVDDGVACGMEVSSADPDSFAMRRFRRYCALDNTRRTTQVVRGIEGRKRISVGNEMRRVDESKPAAKRSRRQGVIRDAGATTPEIADDKYDVGVANAVSFLEQIETSDAERQSFLSIGTKVINCQKCKDTRTETPVPEVLLPLHYLVVHSEKGAEICS
jgi:hypothetical protein